MSSQLGYRGRWKHLLICATAILCATAACMDRGTAKADPPSKADKDKFADEQICGLLARSWSAFYAGKFDDGIKLADPLTKLSDPRHLGAAAEAAYVQARCLWAMSQAAPAGLDNKGGLSLAQRQAAQAKAKEFWSQLDKAGPSKSILVRLKIAKCLPAESDTGADANKKLDQGIEILEGILKDRASGTATAEAAIELARLYVKEKRFDDAKKSLNFAVAFLDKKELTRLEIAPALAEPFVTAAKAAIAHLKYDKNAGLEEFEAAEKLRKAEKFAEAAKAFQAIIKSFPDSESATRGELSIGYCMVGLKQPAEAVKQWEKFIKDSPAGPWRGQAYIAVIDQCLDEFLDLAEADKFAELAWSSLAAGLADEQAGDSWKSAAYDVDLRMGVVAFCQGKGDAAAEAFEAARKLSSGKPAAGGLEALIAAAKGGKSAVPDDVKGKSGIDKPTLALSLGVIYLAGARLDNAQACFGRVCGPVGTAHADPRPGDHAPGAPLPGVTPAQAAFAIFGHGACLEASGKFDQASGQLLASIKADPNGTWHDETLFRLAVIIQDQAQGRFGKDANASKGRGESPQDKDSKPTTMPFGGVSKPTIGMEKARKTFLANAKAQAIPYLQEILKRYPQSPRAQEAWFDCGLIQCELAECGLDSTGKTVTSDKADQTWKEAAFTFNRLCETYPKSGYAGWGYVRQIDIALEHTLDLDLARQVAGPAAEWAKTGEGLTTEPPGAGAAEPWRLMAGGGAVRVDRKAALCELYRQVGIVACLDGKYDQAVGFLRASDRLAPSDGHMASGQIWHSSQPLTELAQKKKPISPAEAIKGDAKAALVLQMADIYHVLEDYGRSRDLCGLVVDGKAFPGATAEQRSWALFKRGRNRFCLDGAERDTAGANADYLAAASATPKTPWAYEGVFLAANIAFNMNHDVDRAVVQWRRLVREYPDCPEAARGAYYIGFAYEYAKRPKEARAAYEEFLTKYPDSPFASLVRSYHLKQVEAMEQADKARKSS
jgi:tetratricopeptide (TPR) repeat protein